MKTGWLETARFTAKRTEPGRPRIGNNALIGDSVLI